LPLAALCAKVAAAMVAALASAPAKGAELRSVEPVHCATVGRLAALFGDFAASRANQRVPEVAGDLQKRLYATYLSYLPERAFAYDLPAKTDNRGSLAEFLKSDSAGQIFVSRTHPGITRGNHFHHTKTEKFLVLEGDAVVRFRRVDGTGQVLEYPVSGSQFRVVDIPPDYTHSIENTGARELIVLFWASEIFDPAAPDTMALNVR
jgi:UDP-2-acetamido-2,6-beta-L-arabino-hexul-4-ose reductase